MDKWIEQHWQIALAIEVVWLAISIAAIVEWVVRTRGGRDAFELSPPRQSYLQLPAVLLVFFVFFAAAVLVQLAFLRAGVPLSSDSPDGRFWAAVSQVIAEVIAALLILRIASTTFEDRLRGFGLLDRRALRHFLMGLVYLLVVGLPLSMVVMGLTTLTYRHLHGQNPTPHEMFNVIRQSARSKLAFSLLATSLVIPIMEEVFFRGLLQSFLLRFFRSFIPPRGTPDMAFALRPPEMLLAQTDAERARQQLAHAAQGLFFPPAEPADHPLRRPLTARQEAARRWAAILVASLIFGAVHYTAMPVSVPALFVLGLVLGYAYERSGSLWTPIGIHVGFNALNTLVFLLSPPTS